MLIYLIRHGETDWNARRVWQGSTDMPLNGIGAEQARSAGRYFAGKRVARVYTSPLSRAFATAGEVAKATGAPITVSEALVEMRAGDFEGQPYDKLAANPRFIAWEQGEARAPFGESKRDVASRVMPAVLGFASQEKDDFVITAHSIVIRMVVNHTLGLPIAERRRYLIENGSVTTLRYAQDNGRLQVVTLNEKPSR
jgi:probable phosphoglycerate mutase